MTLVERLLSFFGAKTVTGYHFPNFVKMNFKHFAS